MLALQLALVLAVIHLFRIQEGFGLLRLTPTLFVGFVVNALLPQRFRLPFFTLLSFASIAIVLPFPHSVGLIGLGLVLIGICHLPVPIWVRATLLLVAGLVLALIRGGWVEPRGWPELGSLVLPLLAAMFMFRTAVYLYDLSHEKKRASIWERLSYFFMAPNICFLLFPVVDYQAYRKSHYDGEAEAIYQKGISWILRGVIQLLLYRIIYQYFVPAPDEIDGLGGVVAFMLTTYLLYLRISGQFHLIIGVLCLFGFNLPTTHHFYYLAPGFNDFWRRINIYWKDFMMKLFFYPAFMRLRRLGMTTGLVLATLIVFSGTWLLHSYQWFWLRGRFPLHARDAVFWGVLGLVVTVNSLREAKTVQGRRPPGAGPTFRSALSVSVRTLGTFSFICILWSLWSSQSIADWFALTAEARQSPPAAFIGLALALATAAAVGVAVQFLLASRARTFWRRMNPARHKPAAYTAAVCALLILSTLPADDGGLSGKAATLVTSIRKNRLNVRDRKLVERGYYEELMDSGSFTRQLWAAQVGRPRGREWAFIRDSNVARPTDDLLEYELIPSHEGSWKDAPFRTNRWGFRDQDFGMEKSPGTTRIALLGASYEVGGGVDNDEIFPSLLEEILNREHSSQVHDRYEVLNCSVPGYGMVQRALLLERQIVLFKPDVVLLPIYTTEASRLLIHLVHMIQAERVTEPALQKIVRRAGAEPDMPPEELYRKLSPFTGRILGWSLRRIAATCKRHEIPLFGIVMPTALDLGHDAEEPFDRLWRQVRHKGLRIQRLGDVFAGHERVDIQLAEWDFHLNALGHELMAEGLYHLLEENEALLRLGLNGSADSAPRDHD